MLGCAAAATGVLTCCAVGTAQASASTRRPAEIPPGTVLAKTADVPVTGGIIVQVGDTSDYVVVAQPQEAVFTAFDAVCTHEGCLVNEVTNAVIICPCHDSEFSVEDGSVIVGPAEDPLPAIAVEVCGDNIVTV